LITQPDAKDVFLWDTAETGFGLKVTPSGKKIYILQYRVDGRQRRYRIGQHGDFTPEEARQEAKRLRGKVAGGNDPAEDKAQKKRSPTVSDLAARYMSEHAWVKKKPYSARQDELKLNSVILPRIGRIRAAAVKRSDVGKIHNNLRNKPYQANRVLALLSKMFSLAEQWGLRPFGSNPCLGIQKFKEKSRERYLSPQELGRLGETLRRVDEEDKELPSVPLAIRLLILTGARLSEIVGLRWEHVDLDDEVLRLPDSKTGAKLIHLNRAAVDLFSNAPRVDGNPFVCPGTKPGGHLVGIQKAWSRIRALAEIKDVRLHDLRHTYASIAAGEGLSLPIIGGLLGHKKAATTERYAHLADNTKKEAANQIGSKIDSLLSRPAKKKVVPFKNRKAK